MPRPRSRHAGTWFALALTAPLALGACGDQAGAGVRDAAAGTRILADTAALSATAGFVETSAAFTDAGILAMLDEANQSDSAAAALALDKATDPETKALAAALMSDHHELRADGERLVKALSITPRLPATDPLAPVLDDEMIALRAAADGPGFDRVYVEKEVVTHQKIIDFAQRARRSTPNTEIRAYIDRTTPVIERLLARTRALQKKLALAA
jgi:predicted outer membrane protein